MLDFERDLQDKAAAEIERAVSQAETGPAATPEDVFAYTYKDMPPRLRGQLADLEKYLEEAGR